MNTTQKGIITLLKSAVTGEKLPLPADFTLESAAELIKKHSLVTLCYQGASLCGIPADSELMRGFFAGYYQSLVKSERQMAAVKKIFRAFEENDIDYLPLKGVKMKPRYPKPELRVMGDADVLIRMEQYEKIVPIMEALGFQAGEETDHELPWRSGSLYLELHKRLIPSYNEDYYAYFGDGWRLARKGEGCCYDMTAEDEWIYLFTHFAKHYRDGGIGCRHVTDLWVYWRGHPGMDMAYVRGELEKLQLLEFHENILRLLAAWFEDAPLDEKSDFITEYIFVSGNFGLLENRALSQNLKAVKKTRSARREWLHQLREALCPGHNIIDRQYPVLEKHPYLLPLFWVVRIFDKLLFQRNVVERRRRTLKVFTQENLDSHHAALNYVGLDFHF